MRGTHQVGVLDIDKNLVSSFAGTGQEALINGPEISGSFCPT